ncbi:MAG: hypothetical protein RMJ87_03275 [Cytophagales bacterium]|nr:hypothetical protein [Bernardetiaceae bacterium]MDW8204029.1 hypothetical protein [Cytophagales bacterium]
MPTLAPAAVSQSDATAMPHLPVTTEANLQAKPVAEHLLPTIEQVQAAWEQFAEQYRQQEKPLIVSMLTWRPITFTYPTITHALRNNATDDEAFKQVRNQLLSFLRQQLNCPQLVLETIEVPVEEANAVKKMYTNTDRFNFLAEQFPLLNNLRNMLGLDIE